MSTEYVYKTQPFAHQEEAFMRSRDMEGFGLFFEMGTGKSKIGIDTAAYLYQKGEINAVLVVAPNSVHTNWANDEIPTHLPDDVRKQSKVHVYQSNKAGTKWHAQALTDLRLHPGLKWLCISYNGFMTKRGKKAVWEFMKRQDVLYILDESQRIKNPSAKRTISINASAKYAKYRRIMTGTPVANGPEDVYTQVRFLQEDFFKQYAIESPLAFRHTFCKMAKYEDERGRDREFIVGYKNLEALNQWLQPITSRVTKDEVLDLPPKLYSRRTFELTPEQRRVYDELKQKYLVELKGGELVTAIQVLTRLLRFQQITCGYVPSDSGDLHLLATPNPRMELLKDTLEDVPHQAIIWAQWDQDIDQILGHLGENAVRFDGKVTLDQREVNKKRFKSGEVQFFVAKSSVAGEGLTLNEAKTELYYNNSFNLVHRLQSEDRAHRIGQDMPVNIIDFAAARTIDEHIIRALRRKHNVASQVTGDEAKEWL